MTFEQIVGVASLALSALSAHYAREQVLIARGRTGRRFAAVGYALAVLAALGGLLLLLHQPGTPGGQKAGVAEPAAVDGRDGDASPDTDVRYGIERIYGPLHRRKAMTELDRIDGKTFCFEDFDFRMRFRKVGADYVLDRTFPDGGRVGRSETRIAVRGFSDQYDAVVYQNLALDEPRLVHVGPGARSIKDITYRSETSRTEVPHDLCTYRW